MQPSGRNSSDRSSTPRIRVLCVDDSQDLCTMFAAFIDSEPDLENVGILNSADGLPEAIKHHRPDVVLLDLTMPGRDPLEALEEASKAHPESRIVIVSGYDDAERINTAIDRGAWGFVSKHGNAKQVIQCIRKVAGGEMCMEMAMEQALGCVAGYAIANDVSARWWQKSGSGGQFVRGKSFDTFCPMSDMVAASTIDDPQSLRLMTKLNGEIMQDARTSQMI